MAKKLLLFFGILFFAGLDASCRAEAVSDASINLKDIYQEMNLSNVVGFKAFEQAITGYQKINPANKRVITVIDFSKPSCDERLAVIDLQEKKLLFSSHVSHGRNSGDNYASSFSNKANSYQSSLGFYITEQPYDGRCGYSLTLEGLEKGINDNAKQRGVVVHGAAYADPKLIPASGGRLGRSRGCPALPFANNEKIIDTIKGGTLLFIYAENSNYLAKSTILQ